MSRIYQLHPWAPPPNKKTVLNTIIHELTMVTMRSHGLFIPITPAEMHRGPAAARR